MTTTSNESKYNSIKNLIDARRLHDAFDAMTTLSKHLMTWEITDEIGRHEQYYRYMLQYAVKGIDDPGRNAMYNAMVEQLYTLLDRLQRHELKADKSTLYFNTLRTAARQPELSIAQLLRQHAEQTAGRALAIGNDETATRLQRTVERTESRLFDAVWTTFPLHGDDTEALSSTLTSPHISPKLKQLLVSALLLGELQYHDSKRVQLLMETYLDNDRKVAPVALVALLLSLYRHRDRGLDKGTAARLKLMADTPHWHSDLGSAFLELVRARDTERLTRRLNEELVPKIQKLRPEISRKMGLDQRPNPLADLDENPQWEEMLQKSGIADKMKEFFEIQLEGGDVFMSTFSHLKVFPFFNDIAAWFTPFDVNRSEIAALPPEVADLALLIENTPVFCNSDKYSFILSMGTLGEQQRTMMRHQTDAQIEALKSMGDDNGPDDVKLKRQNIMNRYVQDLYRFFKLYRRREEFDDPFLGDLNLAKVPALENRLNDSESLRLIAEFYLKNRYWADALALYRTIVQLDDSQPHAVMFQKMGFACERLGELTDALEYYRRAELLDDNSGWTLKHIARTQQLLGDSRSALDYWERYSKLAPEKEQARLAMDMGDCLMDMGDYERAVQQYHKARYLDPALTGATRPLAWALTMLKQWDKARDMYRIITETSPGAEDYLNMGHLALATGDSDNALNYYNLSIATGDGTVETFARSLKADSRALQQLGIRADILPLIIDAVSYAQP